MIGSGPRSPCHGSRPNSRSVSSRRNAGRTSSNVQPGFPPAAQASRSAVAPRTAKRVNQDVPPRTRPRRSFLAAPPPSGSDSNPQSGTVGKVQPSRHPTGGLATTVGPRLEQHHGSVPRLREAPSQDAASRPAPDDRDVERPGRHSLARLLRLPSPSGRPAGPPPRPERRGRRPSSTPSRPNTTDSARPYAASTFRARRADSVGAWPSMTRVFSTWMVCSRIWDDQRPNRKPIVTAKPAQRVPSSRRSSGRPASRSALRSRIASSRARRSATVPSASVVASSGSFAHSHSGAVLGNAGSATSRPWSCHHAVAQP